MGARDLLSELAGAGITVEPDGDRLLIRPASRLTDELRAALRQAKPELLALLAARTCADCAHRRPCGTCTDPQRAGLAERFTVAWPEAPHANDCPAFEPRPPDRPAGGRRRPYALSKSESDEAHAQPWDDFAIARFVDRVARLLRAGFDAADADDLAERLHLRDAQADERRLCVECLHWRGAGRCVNWRAAGLQSAAVGRELATTMQRCPGVTPWD